MQLFTRLKPANLYFYISHRILFVTQAIALQSNFDPLLVTAAVAIAASCAFMLRVATPPNAIVFGSGLIKVPQMAKAGFLLNLVGIVLVSIVAVFLVPAFLL